MSYLPLNVYSGYSFFESAIKLEDYIKESKKRNYKFIGISDINNMYAFPKFNKLCLSNEINPIFSLTITFKEALITLVIKNEQGYLDLLKISNFFNKNKSISIYDFNDYSNLIPIVKTSSDIFKIIDNQIYNKLKIFNDVFHNFYIGLENIGDKSHLNLIRDFLKNDYKLIAFPSIRHLNQDEALTLNLLQSIKTNHLFDENDDVVDLHFFTDEEINNLYLEDEINLLNDLTKNINFTFIKKRGNLINYSKESSSSLNSKDFLKSKIEEGLIKRNIDIKANNIYRNRLNYEFLTITKMGFEDYFLIVQDYVNYAKENNIIVGPGRGSAAGSLISYLLGITDVDPLKYNLIFERFLNPERKTMPDIDTDYQDIKRENVIKYLENKYGYNRVAHVIAFQNIKSKQAIRDICRILNYGNSFADKMCKAIPDNFKDSENTPLTLQIAYEKIDNFRKIVDSSLDYQDIFKYSKMIEGLPRQITLHAAGIILSSISLIDSLPINYINDNEMFSQYEKDYLEEHGFLKFDLLGLSNLSAIASTIELIKHSSNDLNKIFESIPINDPSIYSLLKKDELMGLFQIDASAGKLAIEEIKPNKFIEIVDSISLARPGPIKYIKNYSLRKNGLEKVSFPNEKLKSILSSTYGIIIYQEQIMQIAQEFAGFTMGEADNFRRAISKKNADEILKMKEKFIQGCIKRNNDPKLAEKLFQIILKFANYGFNKSHAVSYAMITAKMAYLKAKYPLEFYSSVLTIEYSSRSNKILNYFGEMKKNNIKIYSPLLNYSTTSFIPYKDGVIFPFSAIKNISNSLINHIIEERNKNGIYTNIYNFLSRIKAISNDLTENQLSLLIDAGTFDEFESNRKSIKNEIPDLIQFGNYFNEFKEEINKGGGFYYPHKDPSIKDDPIERINNEINVLGFSINDNILNHVNIDNELKNKIKNINELHDNNEYSNLLGIIKSIKTITVKNGKFKDKLMSFIILEDNTNDIDVTIFPEYFLKYQDKIEVGKIVLINGFTEIRKNNISFILRELQEVKIDE